MVNIQYMTQVNCRIDRLVLNWVTVNKADVSLLLNILCCKGVSVELILILPVRSFLRCCSGSVAMESAQLCLFDLFSPHRCCHCVTARRWEQQLLILLRVFLCLSCVGVWGGELSGSWLSWETGSRWKSEGRQEAQFHCDWSKGWSKHTFCMINYLLFYLSLSYHYAFM